MKHSQVSGQFPYRAACAAIAVSFVILLVTLIVRADQRITITNIATDTVQVRIDQPMVTRAVTAYPQIQFRPGDAVTVNAGGCVQTGGTGRTWKRYVNPSGPNSDRLYHGKIWIPGATLELVRISTVVDQTVNVPMKIDLPGQLFLRLGYEDDDYTDNGYWGHDDGTEDQCKGTPGGPAFVVLTIKHGAGSGGTNAEHPYDLTWTEVDGNGYPMNARWTSQMPAPGVLPGQGLCGFAWQPPCTTQAPSIHVGKLCAIGKLFGQAGELGGHANWAAVTYEGTAAWDSHSSPIEDDDYNINIIRSDQGFYTSDNPNDVHTEFDSQETVDHFNTSWWQAFHSAVDSGDDKARQFINGKYIVSMGVAGLDCAHSCGSEIHPVFAMALHVEDNASADGWAIFARNSGDEGFCGDEELGIDDPPSVTLTIPWRTGATGVSVKDASEFQTNSNAVTGPIVTPTVGSNVAITFMLPRPEDGARVNGVLYLQWTGTPTTIMHPLATIAAPHFFAVALPSAVKSQLEPEAQISKLVTGMTPELQREYQASTPPKDMTKDSVKLRVTVKEPQHPGPAHGPAEMAHPPGMVHPPAGVVHPMPVATFAGKQLPKVRAFPNPKKAELDQKRIAILKRAYPHLMEATP